MANNLPSRVRRRGIVTAEAQSPVAPPTFIPIQVGPYIYRLMVSARPLIDHKGCELEGCTIEGSRQMLLSHRLEMSRRQAVTLHEFAHAWEFHVPRPRTVEERCEYFAFLTQSYLRDLTYAGGVDAIERLQPVDLPNLRSPTIARGEGRWLHAR